LSTACRPLHNKDLLIGTVVNYETMVRSNKNERRWGLIGLAMTCIAGGLPLVNVPIPRLPGVLMLTIGCAMLLWWSWDESSHFHIVVRVGAVGFVLLLYGYTAWRMYLGRESDSFGREPPKQSISTEAVFLSKKITSVSPQTRQGALHEISVVFYNSVNDPQFFVNGKHFRATKYSSGIATFQFPAGSYTIRAEYPTRTCSATVSVPLTEPAAATCNLR
jgi:hypothetical protein